MEIARPHTDSTGLVDIAIKDANPEATLVVARRGDDFAIDSLASWNLSSDPDRYTIGYAAGAIMPGVASSINVVFSKVNSIMITAASS